MKILTLYFSVIFFAFVGQIGFAAPNATEVRSPSTVTDYIESARQRQSAGLYQEAEEHLLFARDLASKENKIEQQITILISLSDLYLVSGRASKAEQVLTQAERLANENRLQRLLSGVQISKGNLYVHNGEAVKAIEAFTDSAGISLATGDRKQRVIALVNLTKALIYIKDYKKALNYFYKVFSLVKEFQSSSDTAFQLASVARLAQDLLEVEKLDVDTAQLKKQIVGLYDRASLMAEQSGDLYTAAYVYGSLAALYQKENRYQDAHKLLRRAIFLARQVGADELLYRWKWASGRIHRIQGDAQLAIKELREAIIILQRVRPRLAHGSRSIKDGFRESTSQLYFELADLLLEQPDSSVSQKERKWRLVEARQTVELMMAVELLDYFKDNCVTAL